MKTHKEVRSKMTRDRYGTYVDKTLRNSKGEILTLENLFMQETPDDKGDERIFYSRKRAIKIIKKRPTRRL